MTSTATSIGANLTTVVATAVAMMAAKLAATAPNGGSASADCTAVAY